MSHEMRWAKPCCRQVCVSIGDLRVPKRLTSATEAAVLQAFRRRLQLRLAGLVQQGRFHHGLPTASLPLRVAVLRNCHHRPRLK
jgi:hypothetical protein